MRIIHLSATQARNNFFNILNQVLYEGIQVVIGKTGTDREVILMPKSIKKEHDDVSKMVSETFGILPDFPEVTILRRSRQKSIDL